MASDSEVVVQSRTSHKMKSLQELAKAAGRSIEILMEQDCDSCEVLRLIGNVDIDEMELSLGQRCMLRQWHTSLEPRWKARMTAVPGDKASTDSRITEDELMTLLSAVAGMNVVDLARSVFRVPHPHK